MNESVLIDFSLKKINFHSCSKNYKEILDKSDISAISNFLSNININNQKNIKWWSYEFTSKNPNNSPLIDNILDILLVYKISNLNYKVSIKGFTWAQFKIINNFLDAGLSYSKIELVKAYLFWIYRRISSLCMPAIKLFLAYLLNAKKKI